MINETILAIIIAFVISAALCPVVIPMLHKLKFGQQVRQEGPQAHLKKQGTPTMWTDHSGKHHCHILVLSKRLSKDHSCSVCDCGLWYHRFSGRLYQDRHEAFRGLKSKAEVSRTDRDHSSIHVLSDEFR